MYVKQFDKSGKLLNPITKENPFVNKQPKQRYHKQRRKSKYVVSRIENTFYKYHFWLQKVGCKMIEQHRLVSHSSFGLK